MNQSKIISLVFFAALVFTLAVTSVIFGFEDGPSIQDHRETDRIFRSAQIQTCAAEYEQEQLEKESRESLANFKKSKFKKKEAK